MLNHQLIMAKLQVLLLLIGKKFGTDFSANYLSPSVILSLARVRRICYKMNRFSFFAFLH